MQLSLFGNLIINLIFIHDNICLFIIYFCAERFAFISKNESLIHRTTLARRKCAPETLKELKKKESKNFVDINDVKTKKEEETENTHLTY